MQNVISLLEIQRDTLLNNAPINESRGDTEQAALERQTIAEIDQALETLRAA